MPGTCSAPHLLDTRGLLCPLPVIRAQEMAAKLVAGDLVTMFATDPGVLHDLPAWCRVHGHALLACGEQDQEYVIEFKIGAG